MRLRVCSMSNRRSSSGNAEGADPDVKRRRLLDAGGPIEDDEIARQKMREAKVGEPGSEITGFDPDNVVDIKHFAARDNDNHRIKPMGYFAQNGDLKMMRWLYVNGADTRDEEVGVFFPMIRAACFGHIGVCKWLFAHGASADVKRRTKLLPAVENHVLVGPFRSCLSFAIRSEKRELIKWLIIKGVLCKDNPPGELDLRAMKRDFTGLPRSQSSFHMRMMLLKWANGLQYARASFLTFLMGTLSPNENSPSRQQRLWDEFLPANTKRRPNNLSLLSGKSGILELVCDYVGIVWGREARIIRQLVKVLPDFNEIMDSLDG